MKKIVAIGVFLITQASWAAPSQISYQGRLLKTDGSPEVGVVSMAFALCDAAAGPCSGTPQTMAVALSDGFYSVLLSVTPADLAAPRYLSVAVNSSELVPRQPFLGAPLPGGPDYIQNGTALQQASFNVSGPVLVNGPMIRKIARIHALGPIDGTSVGTIVSRKLAGFVKTQASTGVRVTWEDNLRVLNGGTGCQWEIKFNGLSCPSPGAIAVNLYTAGDNHHRGAANIGTCFGLAAGTYDLQVTVGPVAGTPQGSCYTGWINQYWALEAEEVY